MSIIVLENIGIEKWDHDLEKMNGSLFMTTPWLAAICNDEIKPVFLRFYLNQEEVAMLSGIETHIKNTNCKQLLFYSGLALKEKSSTIEKQCKKALLNFALKKRFSRITLKSYDQHNFLDSKYLAFSKYKRIEYYLNLLEGKDQVIGKFHRDFKRRVRKAEKEGVLFKTSQNTSLVPVLIELMQKTYNTRKSKGYGDYNYFYLPHINKAEIEKLIKNRSATFFYAEYLNDIISIQLVVLYQKKAYAMFMGTSAEGYKKGAPSFLFYKIAEHLADTGNNYYNIGGVQRGKNHSGLKTFKSSMDCSILESVEETTNFLDFPLMIYNPILIIKRILLSKTKIWIPWRIKKRIIYAANIILKKKDEV
jgi:hypothetical protein